MFKRISFLCLWLLMWLPLSVVTADIFQVSIDTRQLQLSHNHFVYFLPNNGDKVIEYKLVETDSEIIGYKKCSLPNRGFAFKTSEPAGQAEVIIVSSDLESVKTAKVVYNDSDQWKLIHGKSSDYYSTALVLQDSMFKEANLSVFEQFTMPLRGLQKAQGRSDAYSSPLKAREEARRQAELEEKKEEIDPLCEDEEESTGPFGGKLKDKKNLFGNEEG